MDYIVHYYQGRVVRKPRKSIFLNVSTFKLNFISIANVPNFESRYVEVLAIMVYNVIF